MLIHLHTVPGRKKKTLSQGPYNYYPKQIIKHTYFENIKNVQKFVRRLLDPLLDDSDNTIAIDSKMLEIHCVV